jgi:hypothetical protein
MAKKMYPVQRQFPLILDGSPDTNATIRIDRCLSAINHRLYRQSRVYHAKVDLDANAPAGTVVTVWAIADTWMSAKAYQMAYETFLENSKEERAQLKNSGARWNDFRVDTGLGTAFQKDLLPSGNESPAGPTDVYGTGANQEYQMSEVHDAAGTQKTFAWTGSLANTFNIISEYDATGNTSTHPSTVLGSVAYDGLTDELDDGQTSHLSNDGNLPPYNRTNIEGSVWVKVATLHVAAGGTQKLSTGFFKAPSGLVAVTSTTPFAQDSTILNLEVKSGDYKGVGAPTYLDEGRIYASSKTSSGASHNKRIR